MTLQSERIKEAHRGFRKAEPAARSRLVALNSFGLRYEHVDDFNVIVEGEYHLNLAMSFWRATDGSAQGYLVSALAAEIKRNSPKLAEGRDSVAAIPLGPRSARPHAESSASPFIQADVDPDTTARVARAESSASLLPEVLPRLRGAKC